MDGLTTERSLDLQATWFIDVLGLSLDMLSMGVCTTGRWQTSGRLVQGLNVRTVACPMHNVQCHLALMLQQELAHRSRSGTPAISITAAIKNSLAKRQTGKNV